MAAPVDARRAGVRGDAACAVDQVKLPMVAAGVGGGQRPHDVLPDGVRRAIASSAAGP